MALEKPTKSLIEIPLSDIFSHSFKFDLSLPSALPEVKHVFYPFDPDRFTCAKLTNLNFREKPSLHTTVDLGIPVDKINMQPEIYSPDNNSEPILDEIDELLFGHRPYWRRNNPWGSYNCNL